MGSPSESTSAPPSAAGSSRILEARSRAMRSACVSASPSEYPSMSGNSSSSRSLRPSGSVWYIAFMSSVTPAFAIRFLCFLLARCCCKDCSDRHRTPGQSLHLTAIPLSGATSFAGFSVSSVGVSSLSLCSSSSAESSSSSSEPVSESSSPDERSESSESSSSAPRPSFSGSESSSVESSARAPALNKFQSRRLYIVTALFRVDGDALSCYRTLGRGRVYCG
mmetsp:Transcript_12678/g.57576  ORF Transcript_12678/g.57576 Transcript_12678/m.57576 type:complete len:222 (+) Transcript_12678:509-1174(+)